jgi:hypothetical protein
MDMFVGSGSTMMAYKDIGMQGIGIDMELAYLKHAMGILDFETPNIFEAMGIEP